MNEQYMTAQTFNMSLAERAAEIIRAEVERLKNNLAAGTAVNDMNDYSKIIGEIRGLSRSLEFIDNALTDIQKRD